VDIQAADAQRPGSGLAWYESECGCTGMDLVGIGTLHKSLNNARGLIQVIARAKHFPGQVDAARQW